WETRKYSSSFTDSTRPFRSLKRTVRPWKDTPTGTADNDCTVTDNGYTCPVDSARDGFWAQTWHDAASFSEPDSDFIEKFQSEVRAEMSARSLDDCGTDYKWQEVRDLGSIYSVGQQLRSATYDASAGRIG